MLSLEGLPEGVGDSDGVALEDDDCEVVPVCEAVPVLRLDLELLRVSEPVDVGERVREAVDACDADLDVVCDADCVTV